LETWINDGAGCGCRPLPLKWGMLLHHVHHVWHVNYVDHVAVLMCMLKGQCHLAVLLMPLTRPLKAESAFRGWWSGVGVGTRTKSSTGWVVHCLDGYSRRTGREVRRRPCVSHVMLIWDSKKGGQSEPVVVWGYAVKLTWALDLCRDGKRYRF
jgi:hypothetical protein